MTVRTLQHWQRHDPDAVRSPGRPSYTRAQRYGALRRVGRALRDQGYGAGWRTVVKALGLPVALVQRTVRAWKRRRRARQRRRRERLRTSVTVQGRDALWAIDATYLTRVAGRKVEAEVVKDVASTKTVALEVGAPTCGDEVVALLQHAEQERGTLPLVLVRDNGSAYASRTVEEHLAKERVAVLRNLPRTPQHNPWAERAIGELKADAGLDRRGRSSLRAQEGARMLSLAQDPDLPEPKCTFEGAPRGVCGTARDPWEVTVATCAARLEASRRRLDEHRLRASRGYRTAAQCDRELPPWQEVVDRAHFYTTARRAVARAVKRAEGARAKRLAEREAIFETLERVGVITRTRGGVPLALVKHESIS